LQNAVHIGQTDGCNASTADGISAGVILISFPKISRQTWDNDYN